MYILVLLIFPVVLYFCIKNLEKSFLSIASVVSVLLATVALEFASSLTRIEASAIIFVELLVTTLLIGRVRKKEK